MVKVTDLTVVYGDFTAVKNISFSLSPGEIVGFIGPNGSGKSTTFRAIMNLIDIKHGTIFLNGINSKKNHALKSIIGFLPENFAVFPGFTGREYLNILGGLQGMTSELIAFRTSSFIDMFGLSDGIDKLVSEYSKGMKQKLGIIGAIMHKPKLLILDEPFNGLDHASIELTKSILNEYCKRGGTVLISSHIFELVEKISDRVLIIKDGSIAFDVSSSEYDELLEKHSLGDLFQTLTGSIELQQEIQQVIGEFYDHE